MQDFGAASATGLKAHGEALRTVGKNRMRVSGSPKNMTNRTLEDWERWLEQFSEGANTEAWRGIMCFLRWIQVREENGHLVPSFLHGIEGDLYHSRLLRRLLSGSEPLHHPPPESFGQGWYELVENGKGIATEVKLWEWSPEHKIAINQDIWTILSRNGENEYVVTYRPDGEPYHLKRLNAQEWLLERLEKIEVHPDESS